MWSDGLLLMMDFQHNRLESGAMEYVYESGNGAKITILQGHDEVYLDAPDDFVTLYPKCAGELMLLKRMLEPAPQQEF